MLESSNLAGLLEPLKNKVGDAAQFLPWQPTMVQSANIVKGTGVRSCDNFMQPVEKALKHF